MTKHTISERKPSLIL